MTIVPLDWSHLDQVAGIEEVDGDVHWTRADFERELANETNRFFVVMAPEEREILAYGGYWKAGPEAQITNLVVKREQRRKGIGRRLIEFLLDCARGEECGSCTLEVRYANSTAQALYRSLGFLLKGIRPKIYENPFDDAVMMEKQL
jgi:[ribosomal protein S18]-alanine N-acetyltransferase